MTISVVYDACVLFSATLRDLLMNLAITKIVHAHWTEDIHDEWIRSLLRKRPDLKRESLERTRDAMNRSVRDALVRNYRELIETLHLPDPNDRHVLAAAIQCKALMIVTFNLSDFPEKTLAPLGIKAVHPDNFVVHLSEMNSEKVLEAAREHRASLYRPAKSVDEYLDSLQHKGLPKAAAFLKQHRNEI